MRYSDCATTAVSLAAAEPMPSSFCLRLRQFVQSFPYKYVVVRKQICQPAARKVSLDAKLSASVCSSKNSNSVVSQLFANDCNDQFALPSHTLTIADQPTVSISSSPLPISSTHFSLEISAFVLPATTSPLPFQSTETAFRIGSSSISHCPSLQPSSDPIKPTKEGTHQALPPPLPNYYNAETHHHADIYENMQGSNPLPVIGSSQWLHHDFRRSSCWSSTIGDNDE
jgi:hypothetical protein